MHTHRGSCQICGSLQAVDGGGDLAKHGYTVKEYGFFNGICSGAGHPPFQKSIDLIQSIMERVEKEALELRERIEELSQNANTQVMRKVKKQLPNGRNYSIWEAFTPTEENRKEWEREACVYDVPAAIVVYNRRHIYALEVDVDQRENYVAWQTKRLEGWQPTDLIPVPPQKEKVFFVKGDVIETPDGIQATVRGFSRSGLRLYCETPDKLFWLNKRFAKKV